MQNKELEEAMIKLIVKIKPHRACLANRFFDKSLALPINKTNSFTKNNKRLQAQKSTR